MAQLLIIPTISERIGYKQNMYLPFRDHEGLADHPVLWMKNSVLPVGKMIKVWNITPGRENEPNVLYAGIYIGTNTGQLFYSRDSGDAWKLMADFLPPIYSVEVAELEE